ncbi:MAG: hypothetical protein H6557_11980 [Lewinellaceae bacterium]|nr:hypothetical protein [Phaeodactylibacter sp.]MCB9037328.1 hypothetical protein [Lewinellaceae bacterium]
MTEPPIAPPPRLIPEFAAMVVQNSTSGTVRAWLRLLITMPFLFTFPLWGLALMFDEEHSLLLRMSAGPLLLLAGVGIFLYALRKLLKQREEGKRVIKLMTHGKAVYGRLIEKEKTEANFDNPALLFEDMAESSGSAYAEREEGRRLPEAYFDIDYRFEFQTPEGTAHRLKARLDNFDLVRIKHSTGAVVLYLPDNPAEAVVYRGISNAPEIKPDGHFASAPPGKIRVLIVPFLSGALVIMGWMALFVIAIILMVTLLATT